VSDTGTRFRNPERLVSYLGLNPRVRQSGGQPASHGRITKAGPAHARGMLVEAAWSAAKAPSPLRAFYQRVQARRGMQVAVVATARKLAVLCWHLIIKGEDYAFALPSLIAHKKRKLELRAGAPPARGRRGRSASYSLKAVRALNATWPPKPGRPTAPGRRLAARQTGTRKEGDGRSRQQGDATHQAHRLSSAARLPVPTVLLFARRSAAPATADATVVLAPVKVVLPAGRSTLTAAAGRKIRQPRPGSTTGYHPKRLPA
jgi:hypothetical protein